jgi:two-component system OmpR family sensor kinase
MFKPVAALAAEVDQRGERDLEPIGAGTVPREIRPFVMAIDRLLKRVAESMTLQRRFIAAAAHELRSPLTALSLQAERLAAAGMTESARQRLGDLRRGIERNRLLLDQLLTLARAQASLPSPRSEVSIQALFRLILQDLMPLAEAKNLDIGVASERDVRVVVSEIDLRSALKNLISNAIRYTPRGGQIDLAIIETADAVEIATEDNGPGIAEADRARVFEPFHRGLGNEVGGSGLGLSIVKNAVDRMGGRIVLEDTVRSPTGLRATIIIPNTKADVFRRDPYE